MLLPPQALWFLCKEELNVQDVNLPGISLCLSLALPRSSSRSCPPAPALPLLPSRSCPPAPALPPLLSLVLSRSLSLSRAFFLSLSLTFSLALSFSLSLSRSLSLSLALFLPPSLARSLSRSPFVHGSKPLHETKFQRCLSGKSVFLNSKFHIQEIHTGWMEWGEVLGR